MLPYQCQPPSTSGSWIRSWPSHPLTTTGECHILYLLYCVVFNTSKRMHGMNQTEAASFIISEIVSRIKCLSLLEDPFRKITCFEKSCKTIFNLYKVTVVQHRT